MAISNRSLVFNWIMNRPEGDGEWRRGTVKDIAEALNIDPTHVSQIVGSLKRTNNIDTLNMDGRVVGFKVLAAPRWSWGGKRRDKKEQPAETGTLRINVPNVSRYAEAKEAFEKMKAEMPEYIEASFKEDPMAEEALLLRDRLASSVDRTRELQSELNKQRRELEYLRKAQNPQFKEALKSAGVVHGD